MTEVWILLPLNLAITYASTTPWNLSTGTKCSALYISMEMQKSISFIFGDVIVSSIVVSFYKKMCTGSLIKAESWTVILSSGPRTAIFTRRYPTIP